MSLKFLLQVFFVKSIVFLIVVYFNSTKFKRHGYESVVVFLAKILTNLQRMTEWPCTRNTRPTPYF